MKDKRPQINRHPLLPFKVGDRYSDGVIVNLDPTCPDNFILYVEYADRPTGGGGWIQDPRPAPVRAAYQALLQGVPQHRVAQDLLLHQTSERQPACEDDGEGDLLRWMLRDQRKGVTGCDECPFSRVDDRAHHEFYCDHPDLVGDVGALAEDERPPDWCPLRKAATTVFLEPGS
jgi:hypothetical protein